jgi:serine O-acetyltransferase
MANFLWYNNRSGLARYFQSLVSRNFGSDIHPACIIGNGCVISSASGIIIGETAVIGNNCKIFEKVTLGGTGKESGDRHPKVGSNVTLLSGATVLGNIALGDGCIIDAGSVVTKSVAPFTRVGGVPARLIEHLN